MNRICTFAQISVPFTDFRNEEREITLSILVEFESVSLAYPSYSAHCLNRALTRIELTFPSSLSEFL